MSGRLFTLGEALAVMLAEDAPSPATATHYRRLVSGSEVNVATGLVRMGHRATLVSRLGTDSLGDGVELDLMGLGIDAHLIRTVERTGVLVRGANGEGAMHLRDRSAATTLSPSDVDQAWHDDVDAVFVTGITTSRSETARAAVERTVQLARRGDALVVVDPNHRPALGTAESFRDSLAGLRGQLDVALGDPEELALLAGTSAEHAVDELHASGASLVVVKHGANGVRASDGTRILAVPSMARTVLDTVGAGDAFAAGLISALIEGLPLEAALARGTRIAASVVETLGDIDGIPMRDDRTEKAERMPITETTR
ncbi:sugar kinase [Agromyces sp. Leaf222]|uniref:sugar kinase n=1 Tax=Agromyces sp. Leaf222 TaxID=1735688 RepID=UPI0006FA6321|nr:sugar kinase [Agromyces sp. Leaf222]KQM83608.1 hypothetical protein ASE68_10590 [Agromyces sp. Leaf222]